MTTAYREFEDTASGYGDGGASAERILQEIADNVQLFANNVTTIERKIRLLDTSQDSPRLRKEIIQLTHDTAMLVKYADSSIKKLRQQGRRPSQFEKLQLDRLLATLSSSGAKFQTLQQSTAEVEQEMLNQARSGTRDRHISAGSYNSYTGQDQEDVRLLDRDRASEAALAQRTAQMEGDVVMVEQREEEMRELEHDILEINDIFRDIGTMVYEQGEVIDHIEANVEVAGTRVEQGNKQLVKAVRHKKCSRRLSCCIAYIMCMVLIGVIIAVVVILKITKVL